MTNSGILAELTIRDIKEKFDRTKPFAIPGKSPAAAVLILLVEKPAVEVVFTKRSSFVRNHKNEVAFPGGAYEQGDANLYGTALRETCEEIAICSGAVDYIGALDPFITHYDPEIFPSIASIEENALKNAHPDEEVTAIFTIPLDWLMDDDNWKYQPYHSENGKRDVIFYQPYQGYTVWGMTAAMLQNFIHIIKK